MEEINDHQEDASTSIEKPVTALERREEVTRIINGIDTAVFVGDTLVALEASKGGLFGFPDRVAVGMTAVTNKNYYRTGAGYKGVVAALRKPFDGCTSNVIRFEYEDLHGEKAFDYLKINELDFNS